MNEELKLTPNEAAAVAKYIDNTLIASEQDGDEQKTDIMNAYVKLCEYSGYRSN